MINAKEARNTAESINSDRTKSKFGQLMNKIEGAVQEGKYEVRYRKEIDYEVLNELKECGFKIIDNWSQREGYLYIIQW